MTGRLSAPDNIAYDADFREFVFRQPRDAAELGEIMSADSEEVFSCYRFDGLQRWRPSSIAAWMEEREVRVGYARHVLATATDDQAGEALDDYATYLTSREFATYIAALEHAV